MIYRSWEHYWSEGDHGWTSVSRDIAKKEWDRFEETILASQDDYKKMYLALCKEEVEFRSQHVEAMHEYIKLFTKEDAPKFPRWWSERVMEESSELEPFPPDPELTKLLEPEEEEMTPHIVCMIGIPCSGKTTYSQANYPKYTRVSWDDILVKKYPAKTYNESFEASNFKEMDKAYFEALKDALDANKNIVVDMTLLSRKSRLKRLVGIPKHYHRTAVICQTSEAKFHARNAERSKGGKSIPDNVFRNMSKSFQMPKDDEFDEIIRNLT